jgi:hypothetical protein
MSKLLTYLKISLFALTRRGRKSAAAAALFLRKIIFVLIVSEQKLILHQLLRQQKLSQFHLGKKENQVGLKKQVQC